MRINPAAINKATICISSNYLCGPPAANIADKKRDVEKQINNAAQILRSSGFIVDFKIVGGNLNSTTNKFEFAADAWSKIYKFEFLEDLRGKNITVSNDGTVTLKTTINHKALNEDEKKFLEDLRQNKLVNIKEEIEFYTSLNAERVRTILDVVADPGQKLIVNLGGGHIATSFLLPELQKQLTTQRTFTPTAIIGASDGLTLAFYLASKSPQITPIHAGGLYNAKFLKGEYAIKLPIKTVETDKQISQDVSGELIATSLHNYHNQIIDMHYVETNFFANKIIALESSQGNRWMIKLNKLIDEGVFDQSKALIFGEIAAAINGDLISLKNRKISIDQLGSQLAPMVTNSAEQQEIINSALAYCAEPKTEHTQLIKDIIYKNLAEKISARNPNIVIVKAADQHEIFGHACQRAEYIPWGNCIISKEGTVTIENPFSKLRTQSWTTAISATDSFEAKKELS